MLDEPTAALGVRESATVLRLIERVRARGVAVLFITHNAYHAHASGDRFVVLRRGEMLAAFGKGETIGEVIELMAGGAELHSLLPPPKTSAFPPNPCSPRLVRRRQRQPSAGATCLRIASMTWAL